MVPSAVKIYSYFYFSSKDKSASSESNLLCTWSELFGLLRPFVLALKTHFVYSVKNKNFLYRNYLLKFNFCNWKELYIFLVNKTNLNCPAAIFFDDCMNVRLGSISHNLEQGLRIFHMANWLIFLVQLSSFLLMGVSSKLQNTFFR